MGSLRSQPSQFVVHCSLVNVEGLGKVTVMPEAWVGVSANGVIDFIEQSAAAFESRKAQQPSEWAAAPVHDHAGRVLIPGLVDAHLHAPQYAFLGIGINRPLLEWLKGLTFPYESKCSDAEWATKIYDAVVRKTLSCGTTTATYFATIHNDASQRLVDACAAHGQRAFVGKVSMDRNSPDDYIEKDPQTAIQDARRFVQSVLGQSHRLIKPIVTPRFVPTCTSELMRGLAAIAEEFHVPIQSHVSENLDEIAWVASLHPDCKTYSDVYAKHGLLTNNTVLAHGIHMGDEELKQVKEAGTAIIHCPLSNFSLKSGVCGVKRLLDLGVKVAMGTDISGGSSPSMMNAMKQTLIASQICCMRDWKPTFASSTPPEPLSWRDVLYLATLAGAEALNISKTTGSLAVGKDFDAVLLDPKAPLSPFDVFGFETLENLIEKLLISGDDRNISEVFVAGRSVFHN